MISHLFKLNPFTLLCARLEKHNSPPAGSKFVLRKTRWHELEVIDWGSGSILTDGVLLSAQKGRIFYRKPGTIVQGILPYHSYVIIFDSLFCEDNLSLYRDCDVHNCSETMQETLALNFPAFFDTEDLSTYISLFKNCFDEFIKKDSNTQFYLKANLLNILMLMNKDINSQSSNIQSSISPMSKLKVLKAKDFIDKYPCNTFKLNELAQIAELSSNFFCKAFKDITGKSPINYINQCKIIQSKRLMLETYKSFDEISYQRGFKNYSYFCTLFKKTEGILPSEFRRKNQCF